MTLACSFCGRSSSDAAILIGGGRSTDALICDVCVGHSALLIEGYRATKRPEVASIDVQRDGFAVDLFKPADGAPFTEAQEARIRDIMAELGENRSARLARQAASRRARR